MLFLSLSNTNVEFAKTSRKLTWKSYIVIETLPTTSRVKLIDKKKFAKAVLVKNCETFVVHILALKTIIIYPSQTAQIAALQ